MGEVEGLIGLCLVRSDNCVLFQLKSWVIREAFDHSTLWVVVVGLLVKHFIVLTALWMMKMTN